MFSSSKSESDSSYDIEDLLQIETRCKQLKREKNMLRESQSESFELIRRLELHVRTLSEARSEDEKHIQELERELRNCSQEIDYLQDQLNARDAEVKCLGEHVHSLELKLADKDNLEDMIGRLMEELKRSNSECMFLMQELENKEVELQMSSLCIDKLEESISSVTLEFQCEIESMKLEMITLEQSCFEAKKLQDEASEEKTKMNGLIQEFQVQLQDAQKMIECLDKENKELRGKLKTSEMDAILLRQKIKEHTEEWLENKDESELKTQSSSGELESKFNPSTERSTSAEVLVPVFPKLAVSATSDVDSKEKMEKMSHQIHGYELLVKQLKEELREEKLKAKEEAEDLAQEMAELRYQITGMLEEECKRRACIEQASLQRIAELEAQIQKEQTKSYAAIRRFREA